MSRQRELSDIVLPRIAAGGLLGEGVEFVKCVSDETSSGEAQFASTVCFVTAVFRFRSDQRQFEQPLVVKYNLSDKAVRDWLKLDLQFQNEVIVYEKVLPFLSKVGKITDKFPLFFYGCARPDENPDNYIIVLEDLRKHGFQLSQNILDLDFDHCALTFKQLGAFHALSFIAKKTNTKDFFDISRELLETRLSDSNKEETNSMYPSLVRRAAEPFVKTGELVENVESFQDKLKDSFGYLMDVLSVQEPMGVICHGDFCRNNILFKYNNKTPVDVKFFDLATARYASPMLDFTFFFFLNSSQESRKLYRDKYLEIYHDSLTSNCEGVEVPTLNEFKEEFRKKAVYGFLICSFFKPAMMEPVPFNPFEVVHKSNEEKEAVMLANGGVNGTEVVSNMLRELIESNCVL